MLGLLQPVKASFKKCREINCSLIYHCANKKPLEAKKECIKPKGLDPLEINLPKDNQPSYVGNNLIHNLITNWYKNAIVEDTFGETTVNKKITHIVLSCHADYPDENSIIENEIGRVPFVDLSANSNTGRCESLFNLSDANTVSPNITNIVSSTVFTVSSTIGLHIGDGGYFNINSIKIPFKIINISGNNITVEEPVSGSPTQLFQEIGRIYLVANGTLAPDSGDPVSIAHYKDEKTSSDTLGIVNNIMVS